MSINLKSNKRNQEISVHFVEDVDVEDENIDDEDGDEDEEDEEEVYEDEDLNDEDDDEEIYEAEEVEDEDEVDEDEEEDDEEEDDEDDDDKLVKELDNDEDEEIIMIDNKIMRESVRVPDDERITRKILSKYELARLLGTRVQQIISGAPVFVACINGKSPIQIALDELLAKRIPMEIIRQLPYFKYEVFKLDELKIEITQDDIDGLILAIKL
jgi:DNA-directed RNA polymerase subunit K/omega